MSLPELREALKKLDEPQPFNVLVGILEKVGDTPTTHAVFVAVNRANDAERNQEPDARLKKLKAVEHLKVLLRTMIRMREIRGGRGTRKQTRRKRRVGSRVRASV